MLLRKSIRTPIRFEDEAANFDMPRKKKKQLTVPAFPEMMAEQVTQFNEDATPAAFPSHTLNYVAPSLMPTNESLDGSGSESDLSDFENAGHLELTCMGEEADITWMSLELAVRHRIWVNLRRQHSQEHAAALLQLSEVELQDIRDAVEKRRQCPIDSSRVLATLDAVDDCHGTLMAQLTRYLLIAQSYELAFPNDVERGRRYVRKLQLEGAEWYVGLWWPDPEGSAYLKCVPDTYYTASSETAPNAGVRYPPTADDEYALQADAVAISQAEWNSDTLSSKSNACLSDSEYRELMQAKAARLRLSRATGKTLSQTGLQKHLEDINSPPTVSKDVFQAVQKKSQTTATRRPIVIKAGTDREEPSSTIATAAPKTPTRNQPQPIPSGVEPIDQMTPQVASHLADLSSDAGTPAGDRSSGSMSLRNRDSLRETPAMASMRQNNVLLEGVLNDDAPIESEDEAARQPHTLEKKVILKINKKNALACVYRGERRIGTAHSDYQINLSHSKGSKLANSIESNGVVKHATGVIDEPELFARHMDWSKFAKAERERLLSKPIDQRSTVEMWQIYGTNTWKSDSPWNSGRIAPMFTQPALCASLDPNQASTVLGRFLVDEWNRYQCHGVGQELFEETAVGFIIVYFYTKMMEMRQMRQKSIRDEQTLEASRHLSRDRGRIDPHRRYHEEVQHWRRELKLALDGQYDKISKRIGKILPSVAFSTPSITRVNPADYSQSPNMHQYPSQQSPALNKSPEQPIRKATSDNFTMKLIETPSTGAGQAMTPPEDDLGIFGAKDVGFVRGTQPADFAMQHSVPSTPTRNDISNLLPKQKDNDVVDKQELVTQLMPDGCDQIGLSTANLPAEAEDIVMVDAIPGADVGPPVRNVAVAGTPKEQKRSPRRPSWSPISESDEFHSASSTPILSHGQRSDASSPRVIYTPGRLTFLLKAALSETTPPDSEAGELVNEESNVEHGKELQDSAGVLKAGHIKESVTPSIEPKDPAQQHKQVGRLGIKPKLKLTIKQPATLNPIAPESPENSVVPTTEQDLDRTSTRTSKDATPVSEVSSMVTRSMTTTPAPSEMPTPAIGATKKRKAVAKSNLKPKSTKKTKSATPFHAQVEAVKREESREAPAKGDSREAISTHNVTAQKKAKAKAATPASITPRKPRGPYKRTREKIERIQADKQASERAGERVMAI